MYGFTTGLCMVNAGADSSFFGDLCMTPFTWLRLAIIIIVLSYQVLLFSQHLWHHATHNMHHLTLLVIALWLLL